MSDNDIEIDWERKFQDAVTGHIRSTAAIKRKLTDTQLELDQERLKNRNLEIEVARLDPVKAAKERRDFADQMNTAVHRIAERDETIRNLVRREQAAERVAMEAVIADLQWRANKLPLPPQDDTTPREDRG